MKLKKNILTIVIFVLLAIIATIYPYFFTNLATLDEIWVYGFAKNILDGLIPYKDFSMIIPPLFPTILSGILFIFGEKLIVYYAIIGIIVSSITYLAFKKIGLNAIIIFLLLLVYSTNGYNTFTLLLLMLLLSILDKKTKQLDIIIPIIISFMILSKQTMALLVIPSLFYSKNKKKTLITYITIFLALILYLLINNNIMEFIDYCILGMFEFTEKNSISVFVYLIIEIAICVILFYTLIKSKGKRKDAFYVLMYQIITFPIVDISHFILAVTPSIYLLFQETKLTKFYRISASVALITIACSLLFISNYTTTFQVRNLLGYSTENNFLNNKLIATSTNIYINQMDNFIKKFPNDNLYILGNYSYLVKLSLDIPINKFDLINNGNMGYDGARKYIKEIKETCQKEECLFIVNEKELKKEDFIQTNYEILKFVTTEYPKIYSASAFGVYHN